MDLTRTRFSRLIRIILSLAAAAVVLAYAAFRSIPYFEGPTVTVFQPIDGSSISTSTVTVVGQAKRVVSLSVNGHPISIDEKGNFSKAIIVFPGANFISFEAADQFKRTKTTRIEIYGSY